MTPHDVYHVLQELKHDLRLESRFLQLVKGLIASTLLVVHLLNVAYVSYGNRRMLAFIYDL